ncbi:uncharacterized protein LOC134949454 [Pseudophryne corroboree]|uniref:uncharacterized protein LOC134949454 n=1 Tax=Pseudophryne corroboree TaxID=495146 RepID=UPI0030815097
MLLLTKVHTVMKGHKHQCIIFTVRKQASTSRTQATLSRAVDAGDTGTSTSHHSPQRRPSQGSGSHTIRPSKRRHPDDAPTPALSTPPRRISTVLPQPPEHILESTQSQGPHSPQLSEPDIMPPEAQQESEQETYTLQLQAIDVHQPSTPQESIPPPQMSPHPQLSQTIPPHQPEPSFWSTWNQQQAQNIDCLRTHTQYLACLPHHLPRLCRNTSRLNVQLCRVANSMEQMRAGNSQLIVTFQRIMDEQHRHQQALIQLIQSNQIISETMSRIIDNNTTATTQLTANLSQNINLLAQHQQGSISGTNTPTQTPISSPVRRSSRTCSTAQTKPTSATKEQPKK